MLKVPNPKINKNYLLNFSGINVVGKLIHKTDKMTLLFKVICPFESIEKNYQFIYSDILGESDQTYIEYAIGQLYVKLNYSKDFNPSKVGYFEQRIKEVERLKTE